MTVDQDDPKGLVRESFLIEGITPGECRSIFVDWALSLGPDVSVGNAIGVLLSRHAEPDHPMTAVLREGLDPAPEARRRGGRTGRMQGG